MADADALLVYRSLETADLLARKAKFLALMSSSTYSSQTIGQKSFTRDLRFWRDQLAAIVFVLNERSNNGYVGTIVTDFSQLGDRGRPAGTSENF